MIVTLTQEHLCCGDRHNPYRHPIALAVCEALLHDALPLGLPGGDLTWLLQTIYVHQGPSVMPIMDVRSLPDAYQMMTKYHIAILGDDYDLPFVGRYFCTAWKYGPKSGPFAVRSKQGTVMHSYANIIRPCTFEIQTWNLAEQARRIEALGAGAQRADPRDLADEDDF